MSAPLYSVLCLLLTTLRLTFPYCLCVCLALLGVMFITYHVMLVVSLLSACLPCEGGKGPSRIVCFLGGDEGVMMGKLCVSLAGEAVIPQWRKRYKGRTR